MATRSTKRRQDELRSLPPGVALMEWSRERQEWQNPRIRTLLGCINLIGGVLESNYAILHCSPDRLRDIWRRVCSVSRSIKDTLRPLLAEESVIPAIEEERSAASAGLDMLCWNVLDNLDESLIPGEPDELLEVRKQLCVAIGQINGYLQDTFGRVMAADPRSQHDSDYYLSHRFPRDIEEAEWLYTTVTGLHQFLEDVIKPLCNTELPRFVTLLSTRTEPGAIDSWSGVLLHLDRIMEGLVAKLKEILALRGIRFAEMEALDRYTLEIPRTMAVLTALHELLLETDANTTGRVRRAVLVRIIGIVQELDAVLLDLSSFVPLWLASIEERRALLLKPAEV
jgi:hypothetical protein